MSGPRTPYLQAPSAPGESAGPACAAPASTAQRATAVCALVTRRGRGPGWDAALARIHGVYGTRTRAVVAALVSAPRAERDRAVAAVVAAARGPGGRALAGAHESWTPVPEPAGDASARRWLSRRVVAPLVAMPAGLALGSQCPPAAQAAVSVVAPSDLPCYPAARIEAALARLGAELARSPGQAMPAGLDRRGDPRDDALALVRLGARAIAPHVRAAGGDLAAQIAQRMPRPLGRIVFRELASCPAGDRDADPAVLALLARLLTP